MIHGNAEVLLFQKDGSVILQVRDDKPGITNPGLISSFGGHIEPGEEPIDAAVREINEETNLNIAKDQLIFYDKRHKTKEVHGEDWDVYYFGSRRINTQGLQVFEGAGFTVIHNLNELRAAKTSTLLKEVLTDYFEGFRKYQFYSDIDDQNWSKLYKECIEEIKGNHQVSKFKTPIIIACAGLVASGKSTITSPLAQMSDCVRISSDLIREKFHRSGFNFDQIRPFVKQIVEELAAKKYNIFLDFNIATNVPILDMLAAEGYRTYILHANPPIEYIENKILSGNMKHELTFFAKDKHVHASMLSWKDEQPKALAQLKNKYSVWHEVDTSDPNLDTLLLNMKREFASELEQLSLTAKH